MSGERSGVEIDETKPLRVARMSYGHPCIDQLLNVGRVIFSRHQHQIRIGRLTHRQVHYIFQYLLQVIHRRVIVLKLSQWKRKKPSLTKTRLTKHINAIARPIQKIPVKEGALAYIGLNGW